MKRTLVLAIISLVFLNMGMDETIIWMGDQKYPIQVFEEVNGQGKKGPLQLGLYPEIDYFLDWEDGIKSIKIQPGYEMMCYSFIAFQGEKYHLSKSSMDLESDAGFSPMSVKIIKTKEPEACSNYIRFEIEGIKKLNEDIRLRAEEKFWYEASSFCASCGEQIGVDYARSGFAIKLAQNKILNTSGTVTCLTYPAESFFDVQADKE